MSTRDPEFPVDSFREAATHLRRPFTPAAVKFKVQANLGPKSAPTGGLVVAYIDARLVVDRLNLIIPDRWSDHYEPTQKGLMWCHLTVDGITRSDIGQGVGKALVSDALKRAAVRFGIGVPLYATPTMILNVSDGHVKIKQSKDGPTCVLTPNGETHVRKLYESWLNAHGKTAFGEPLDHGDVEGAQGDAESGELPPEAIADDEPPAARPAADLNSAPAQTGTTPSNGGGVQAKPGELPANVLQLVIEAKADAQLPDTAEAREWVRKQLADIGVENVPQKVTLATLKRLTEQQASDLIDLFEHVKAQREAKAGAGS